MIKHVRIFDMDGTLVNSSHRCKFITEPDGRQRLDLQYWRDNEYRAMEDTLLPLAEFYKECLRGEDTYTVIATARVMNSPDWQFVNEILGKPDYFISRAADDQRSGGLLKVLGLSQLWHLKQFKGAQWTFYEDNMSYLKTVCDHFKIRGVYLPSNQGH